MCYSNQTNCQCWGRYFESIALHATSYFTLAEVELQQSFLYGNVCMVEHLAFHLDIIVNRLEQHCSRLCQARLQRRFIYRFRLLPIFTAIRAQFSARTDLRTTCRRSHRHHSSISLQLEYVTDMKRIHTAGVFPSPANNLSMRLEENPIVVLIDNRSNST